MKLSDVAKLDDLRREYLEISKQLRIFNNNFRGRCCQIYFHSGPPTDAKVSIQGDVSQNIVIQTLVVLEKRLQDIKAKLQLIGVEDFDS